MGSLAREVKGDLLTVVMDENDNLDVRWMAAIALENMEQNMSVFFNNNNLINPKKLTPAQCPNDLYNPEFDSEADTDSYHKELTVDINKLVYAGRCIYGNSPQAGGTAWGLYERLKALLTRR
jgi:hypothetical protein